MDFKDEAVQVAVKHLLVSTDFKRPRMDKIKSYEDVYAGKEKPRLRIQFAVPLPVLPGMVDALRSDFDDEIALRFKHRHPADFIVMDKMQKIWDVEATSLRPNARWDLKTRWDKFLAIMSGRAIQKTYAESDPQFRLNFETVDYRYFHCEPKGGGLLENHLFVGEEGIFKTKSELEEGAQSGLYDPEAVKKVIAGGQSPEHKAEMEALYSDKLNRFSAQGFDAENNNYVGETVYNLCQWQFRYKGKRWYMLFDPWTKQAVRLEENKKVFESNLWMYTSWATHEDPKIFWSKSYTDDFFPIHDAIYTLLNQELTNRQKRNLGAKAVDPEMFTDLMALDDANSRPDKIVPVKVPPGKTIQDGIFLFQTPELQGTINLVEWLQKATSTATGVDEVSQQANGKTSGAQVMFTSLQSASKKLSHKAKSFQETYAEVGLRVQHGAFENLSEEGAVKLIGVDGVGWTNKIEGVTDCKVVSLAEEDKENIFGKDQKIKALDRIIGNPILLAESNAKKISEIIYKDVGGWKDEEVEELMDKQALNTGNMTAKADIAILQLRKGKTPDLVYDATDAFAERIIKFVKDHKNELKEKAQLFMDYVDRHMDIISENMNMKADQMIMQRKMNAGPADPNNPNPAPGAPATAPDMSAMPQRSAMPQMTDMAVGGMQ